MLIANVVCVFVFIVKGYAIIFFFFFFNDTATTEIYTLSLHDALPICGSGCLKDMSLVRGIIRAVKDATHLPVTVKIRRDRKSTRLNSSHLVISYAVFCLKKKKKYSLNGRQEDLSAHRPTLQSCGCSVP